MNQGGDRHEAREAGQVPNQRFALDLFLQVELDVGPQRGCPVVGVPDYRQAAVPEHGVEIEVGSQLMRQERIHASVDRAPAKEVDAGPLQLARR